MRKLWRRIVESEWWFWNWDIISSYSNNLLPSQNYTKFQHIYSGKIVVKKGPRW